MYCVIHQQHLVAKNLSDRLNKSLKIVIICVNKIKSNLLNPRIFELLCKTNDEDFDRLLFHIEVRWLSKGNFLKQFYKLYDSVIQFLENRNVLLASKVKARKCDVAFLTDLFNIFNEVNLKLQGSEIVIVKVKSVITLFVNCLFFSNKILDTSSSCNFLI